MRHGFIVCFSLAFFLFGIGTAVADFRASETWFNKLTEDQRADIQADLILLGFYDALVDGLFGPSTYKAISEFEVTRLVSSDGVLTATDLNILSRKASEVYREFGFRVVRDTAGQMGLLIPTVILSERSSTALGNAYSSPDSGIILETVRKSNSSQSFIGLFRALSRPSSRRSITYASNLGNRFVISGRLDGRYFYAGFYSTPTESVGYSISWTEKYRREGSITSTFLASHSAPLMYMEAETKTRPSAEPQMPLQQTEDKENSEVRRFGAFILVNGAPQIIALHGDIASSAPLDFRRALKAQPDTTTVVLNSDGGMVSSALIIAHTIQDMGLDTYILPDSGCYSACAFLFFAGASRRADGELGVHQISTDAPDLISAQTTLSDIIEALEEFGVSSSVLSFMLRTPPEGMYIFSKSEIASLKINSDTGGAVFPTSKLAIEPKPKPQVANELDTSHTALLLEPTDGITGAIPFIGTVDWSRGVDEFDQLTLVAKANIPARDLRVDLLIKQNSDLELPASFLMEITFTLGPSFAEKSISNLPGILMKDEELSQGEILVGASARVLNNKFLFALGGDAASVNSNRELLLSGRWMDIAIIYESGKQVIVTLEKKAKAAELFREMFDGN